MPATSWRNYRRLSGTRYIGRDWRIQSGWVGRLHCLRFAAIKHADHGQAIDAQTPLAPHPLQTLGIGGFRVSPYIRAMGDILLPVALVIGSIHVLYGHDQPGDGFTAGVIIGLAIGFGYVVFGFQETRRRLWWLRPNILIAIGISIAIVSGAATTIMTGSFLFSG